MSMTTVPAMAKATTSGGRGEEVRADVGMDARFEVAVAREHGGAHEVVLDDRLFDGRRRADRRCRCRWCSRRPPTLKPSFSRYGSRPAFARYSVTTREPGASEVLTCGFTLSPCSTAFLASRPAASSTPGFEVLVQEVMAAIRTSPLPERRAVVALVGLLQVLRALREAVFLHRRRVEAGRSLLHVLEVDAVLRALGAGERRHDRGKVELEHFGCNRSRPRAECRTGPGL